MAGKRPSTSSIYAYAESLRRDMLADYSILQEAEYDAAVNATNGYMVNARGLQKCLNGWDVFHGAPNVFDAYATDELRDYTKERPRTTRTTYEHHWLESHVGR